MSIFLVELNWHRFGRMYSQIYGGGWEGGGLELKEKQCNFSPPSQSVFWICPLFVSFSFFLSFLGVQCEECTRATATSSCSKCETVYCRACFERVCLLFLSSSEHASSTPQLSLRKSLNEKALSGISLGRSLRKQRICQKLLLKLLSPQWYHSRV